jgi:RNA polymerase sigma-70 factor (ECF subfamily)
MSEEEPDRTIVERCLSGDVEAFGVLVERYERPVFNVILHMVGDYEDAREVSQQVFMKCFEHLGSYDSTRKFFSWIYRIAINQSLNHVKSRRTGEPLDESLESGDVDASTRVENSERRRDVRRVVRALTPDYRVVVILRHYLQLSYREIAETLEVDETTVRWRLYSARRLMRDALAAQGYAEHS